MGLGLQAPAAVPVEVLAAERRVFRLSRAVGEEAICLVRPAPFEVGRPVEIRLRLPEDDTVLSLQAKLATVGEPAEQDGAAGGCGLLLVGVPAEARRALADYVVRRLGLHRERT